MFVNTTSLVLANVPTSGLMIMVILMRTTTVLTKSYGVDQWDKRLKAHRDLISETT